MTIAVNTGFTEAERTNIAAALSTVLADSYALYLKTHGYHWNVTGPTFQALHTLFEGQYREEWQALDDIAERIRAENIQRAYDTRAPLRLVIAKTGEIKRDEASEDASQIKKEFSVRTDLIGKVVEWDGDRYVLRFERESVS